MTDGDDHVLVVDDDELSLDILTRRLRQSGLTVEAAGSGEEAVERLVAGRTAIALLDIEMPDMSGLDVLKWIRERWPSGHLPVIMVTARDQSPDIVGAFELGADDYITKPVDFAVTLARIKTQLARRRAERQVRASEERYALASHGADVGLWDWDLRSGEIHFSERWKTIIGFGADEGPVDFAGWIELVHTADRERFDRELQAHLDGETAHFETEYRIRHHAGSYRWVIARGVAVRNEAGQPVRIAGSQSDVTSSKIIDPLTGLPNRVLLLDRLERVIELHRQRAASQFAVLFIDLDGFKIVNDSMGHVSGDELLQMVAQRLLNTLRHRRRDPGQSSGRPHTADDATLARLGGDEFVVLLHEVGNTEEALHVAERIHRALEPACTLGGRQAYTSASIGIAVASGPSVTPNRVLENADTAMYRAKALGKGRTAVFDSGMRDEVLARLQLDTSLRLAAERGEFVPHYQPIVNLATGRVAGFEALIRWQHPSRGLLASAEFIDALEASGLIVPVGLRLFDLVCHDLRRWLSTGGAASVLQINVNFSGLQLDDEGLLDQLLRILRQHDVAPEHIVMEITESMAIGTLPRASEAIDRLRSEGLRVVLDDFGTGYSSLSCLHALPIVGVKLDRSFISDQHQHPCVVPAIVGLATQLGLTVTAEGVESEEQHRQLCELGCTYAQGFLFSQALDAQRALDLIRSGVAWRPKPSRA